MLYNLIATAAFIATCVGWSIPDTEVSALCDFYVSTGGPEWTASDGWAATVSAVQEDPCTWYGVTCKDGHVNALSLPRNNLNGVFVESFGDLTELISFDFGANKMHGQYPKSLTKLTKLYALSVRENEMSGPLDFSAFPEMEYAHMDFNHFSGDLSTLTACKKLAVLGLTDNNISGSIPDEFQNMKYLQTLFLGGNNLTGSIPGLPTSSLRTVDLGRNSLSGAIPFASYLSNPNLVEFNLFSNRLSGTLSEISAAHQNLVVLDAHANAINGKVPTILANGMKNMDILHLQDNLLEGTLADDFSSTSIYSTNLTNNRLSCPLPPLPEGFEATCIENVAHKTIQKNKVDLFTYERSKKNNNGEKVNAKPVSVVIHGEAKCPDMGSIEDIFEDIVATLGEDVVDVTLGWIARENAEYPTGYWSLHGQTEVIGNAYTSCAAEMYGMTKALAFTKCLNVNISVVPTNARECAGNAGLDFDALRACALGDRGAALLKEGVALSDKYGAVWSPTIYIDDQLYCLWHSSPCKASKEADFGKAVCDAYTGTRPEACSKYDEQ